MRIGVPREIKNREYRVGLTPDSVRELHAHGHELLVETAAGAGIGCSDEDYRSAGATIAVDADSVFAEAEMIVKVKEPQPDERRRLRPHQVLFTYLHLAPDPEQTGDLLESDAICIAYETVTDDHGHLPLLAPMSQVAGRMSIQAGAHCLERAQGGSGILLGGVPGVAAARVAIIGGGVVGENAAAMAIGLGADVVVLDRSVEVLNRLAERFGPTLTTVFSTRQALEDWVMAADLVIGAVLVTGAGAPKLVTREMVARMAPGKVLVDVAIDQGGCFETSHPTTHDDPTFLVDQVVHYCVANMPGAVPRTSNFALNNVTLPFVMALAEQGVSEALGRDVHLRNGLNVCRGQVTHPAVAAAMNLPHVDPMSALGKR